MDKTEVKVLLPFVSGKQSFGHGDKVTLDQETAYKYALKGVVEFKTKKEFEELHKKIKAKEIEEREDQEKKEKKAAAILYRDELLAEKTKLLNRVAEINTDLGIEDVIINKPTHENLVAWSEMVAVPKDEFIKLIENSEMINVSKPEYDKLTVNEDDNSNDGSNADLSQGKEEQK